MPEHDKKTSLVERSGVRVVLHLVHRHKRLAPKPKPVTKDRGKP